jgi:hypothetical protein
MPTMPPMEGFEDADFWTVFMTFKDWFLTIPFIFQVLVIAALTAITVGSLVLTYYIIKGVFWLLWQIFKLFIELFKAIFGLNKGKTCCAPQLQPVTNVIPTPNTTRPATPTVIVTPPAQTQIPTATKMFCPNCGQSFTDQMITMVKKNGKTFCEFCGSQVEIQ